MVADVDSKRSDGVVKFLCSYGGKIVPRAVDGKLRYIGGMTRVLAVDRTVTFAELLVKLGEFCGYSVELRCQLPHGDLEVLVSIKSDEELEMIIEEYEKSAPGSKIKAVLSPPKGLKSVSPNSSVDLSPVSFRRDGTKSPPMVGYFADKEVSGAHRCGRESHRPLLCDVRYRRYQH